MTRRSIALPLLIGLLGCPGETAENAVSPRADGDSESPPVFQGRVFERNVVFLTSRPDSVLLVPWLMAARTLPGGVQRQARGLLARSDTWEPFFADEWETAPTRVPWRVLPRGRMRLVVGEEDALEQIVFDEGPRQLDVVLQSPIVEWDDQRGETFRILQGALVLSNTHVPGLVLDMTRGRRVLDPEGGDWAFVAAGDTLQVVLHAGEARPPGSPEAFRAWARVGDRELDWPDVTVTWEGTRSFERARREVPVAWSAESTDGELRVVLRVRAAHVQAGEGEGPQLPVDALFAVEGDVRIGDAVHPVRGLLRHAQP